MNVTPPVAISQQMFLNSFDISLTICRFSHQDDLITTTTTTNGQSAPAVTVKFVMSGSFCGISTEFSFCVTYISSNVDFSAVVARKIFAEEYVLAAILRL